MTFEDVFPEETDPPTPVPTDLIEDDPPTPLPSAEQDLFEDELPTPFPTSDLIDDLPTPSPSFEQDFIEDDPPTQSPTDLIEDDPSMSSPTDLIEDNPPTPLPSVEQDFIEDDPPTLSPTDLIEDDPPTPSPSEDAEFPATEPTLAPSLDPPQGDCGDGFRTCSYGFTVNKSTGKNDGPSTLFEETFPLNVEFIIDFEIEVAASRGFDGDMLLTMPTGELYEFMFDSKAQSQDGDIEFYNMGNSQDGGFGFDNLDLVPISLLNRTLDWRLAVNQHLLGCHRVLMGPKIGQALAETEIGRLLLGIWRPLKLSQWHL